MTAALIYHALEHNTGKVGLASVACTSIKAVNLEIAAIQQHQDPASSGAVATNKAIVLELAKQIASVGSDPQDALKSGTFAPGNPDDNTGAGNTCDTEGCIFTQDLLIEDASADEINAAIAGIAAATSAAAANSTASACPASAVSNDTAAATPAAAVGASNLDLGSCSDSTIVFDAGFDGRKEDSFEPADTATSTHGSALNIKVIADFICGQLSSKCKASDAAISACTAASTAAETASSQAAAEAFNSGLGFSAATKPKACTPVPVSIRQSRRVRRAALDFGSCSNPAIVFSAGFDGRKEDSFEPADTATFTHGSALNIKVITSFIISQLQAGCKASTGAISAAESAATVANALMGQAAADAWNSALGVSA